MNKERRKRIDEALELISQAKDILEEVKDVFSKEMLITNDFYWQEERRHNAGISTNHAKRG